MENCEEGDRAPDPNGITRRAGLAGSIRRRPDHPMSVVTTLPGDKPGCEKYANGGSDGREGGNVLEEIIPRMAV